MQAYFICGILAMLCVDPRSWLILFKSRESLWKDPWDCALLLKIVVKDELGGTGGPLLLDIFAGLGSEKSTCVGARVDV